MKKLLLLFLVIVTSVAAFSQGTPYPNYQPQGSPTTRWTQQGAVQGVKGIINGIYSDTSAANIGHIDYYPGAQIFTTDSSRLWVRNKYATAWLRSGGNASGIITSFTMITDSSVRICYSDGSCDTIPFNNFTNNITVINDSTIQVCDGVGSCVTVNLGSTNTYSIYYDTTSNNYYAVTCDTAQTVCVGDSCYQQQICDTILIPRIVGTVYQNGVWLNNGTVEHGYPTNDLYVPGELVHNTYLGTNFNTYTIHGRPQFAPPVTIQNTGWSQSSSSVIAFNHQGGSPMYYPNMIDNYNRVDLRLNYINRFATPTTGDYVGDTIGTMYDRIGYSWMTNAAPYWLSYQIDNVLAKQVGVMFHTLDTENTDAVTIFGEQVPAQYTLDDSTLLSKRIAVFKTNQDVQFPNYPNTRNDGVSPSGKGFYADADGNLLYGAIGGGGGSEVTILNDSTIEICNGSVCDTFDIGTPITNLQNVFVINDSTLLVCNVDNTTCDTVDLSTPAVFDRGFFDPNQATLSATVHNANNNDFTLTRTQNFDVYSGTPSSLNFGNVHTDSLQASIRNIADGGSTIYGVYATTILPGTRLQAKRFGTQSDLFVYPDSIFLQPWLGKVTIDSLRVGASTDSVMVWNKTTGYVGYRNASSFGITGITADNGLTANTSTNVKLGGTLLQNTTIDATSSYYLILTGARTTGGSNRVLSVTHTNDGVAIYGESGLGTGVYGYASGGGNGVIGSSPTGTGVNASTNSSRALYASAVSGKAIVGNVQPISTNTVVTVFELQRQTSATAANGIGGSFDFKVDTDAGGAPLSNQLISKWVVAADATRTSQLDITGVNSASTQTIMSAYGTGVVGIGISSSYTATRLNVVDNSLAGASMVDLTSTSTAAASDLQKILNISLSGTSASGGQTTYGGYVSNTHGGSGTNYGLYVTATTGSTNIGVRGSAETYGLFGESSGGIGVRGTTISGTAAGSFVANGAGNGITVSTQTGLSAQFDQTASTGTNDITDLLQVRRQSSNTVANGFGARIGYWLETDNGSLPTAGAIEYKWKVAANATRTSNVDITAVNAASTVTSLTIGGEGFIQLRPITATAASAITPAEGQMLFVSDTNGTFTSVGFWGYQGGSWIKM